MRSTLLMFLFCFLLVLPDAKSQSFPRDWQGEWVGNLLIYSNGKLRDTVKMQLNIDSLASGKYTWQIIYGEDNEKGLRDYLLLRDSVRADRFWIDEQNSIVLPASLVDNRLLSSFNVAKNVLFVKYELLTDKLQVEISSAPSSDPYVTGGAEIDGEEIPPVRGYYIQVFQTALLRRKN